MKILVIGYARHGKDAFAKYFSRFTGKKYLSSSRVALETIIWPALREQYASLEECFDDRANCRTVWFDLIRKYNTPDGTRLVRRVYDQADMYIGLRSRQEFEITRPLHDLVIWIDACDRLPEEGRGSNELSSEDADIVIENNGSLIEFVTKVHAFSRIFA